MQLKPKHFIPALLLLTATAATSCFAHVKWFVPLTENFQAGFTPYSLTETSVLIWVLIAIVLIGLSVYLDRLLPSPAPLEGKLYALVLDCLRFLSGLAFVISTIRGVVFAPHFHWVGPDFTLLLGLQFVIGCCYIMQRLLVQSSLLLLVLYVSMCFKFGVLALLEYFNIVGIAVFMLLLLYPNPVQRVRLSPWALPVLRIATGIALVFLGFGEKLLRPDYAQEFVGNYMWNFMQNLGVQGYSDRLFVLSAGSMEVVFGIILLLGTTTRLNILVVSLFMFTSNLTFFLSGDLNEAMVEIVGHMPIIAIALVLVLNGAGDRLILRIGKS